MTLPLVPGVLPAEVVAALAQAAALRLPPEVVYDLVRRQVERMVETDAFYLALWEPRTERIHFVMSDDGAVREGAAGAPLGEGPTSWVIRHRRSLVFNTAEEHAREARPTPFGTGRRSASGAHVPLLFGEEVVGVLSAQSYEPGRFPPELVLTLEALASHAAVALAVGRLARAAQDDRDVSHGHRAELERRLRELELLRRSARQLAGTADAGSTMRLVAEEGARLFGASHACVVLVDAAARTATTTVAINLPPEFTAAFDRAFHALPHAERLLRGEVVFIEDARRREYGGLGEAVRAAGFVSVVALPLVFGGEVIGVLAFGQDRARAWGEDETGMARAFADQAALAIGKARLLDTVTQAKSEWQLVFDAAPSGLAIVDREGRVARGNLTLARLTGVPLQGLPGCALPALFPEWPAGDADPLARAREGATSSRLIAGPGGRMLVLTLAPERAGRIVAVVDDITREQEAHEALRRSEARFRALLEAAPVAILTIERTGTVEAVNATAQALVGLPDVPRAFLADLVVPGDRSFLAGQCQQAFGGARRECTVHFRRPDGTVREVALVLVPIEERGGVRTVLGIARDVTDERALQERVAHAEKMAALGQLVSGVAHELNNPLAGITALAEALALDVQDEGTERVLETIRREAARAARIVQDLLLFSHQRPLVRRAVDLPALLREAVAAPGVDPARWELVAEGEVPPADADPDQLLQVLRNLVRNADQAMAGRPGARGRLRAWAEGDRVACEVADEGPGIAPDVLNRIFEPFFTTKPAGEGTGLGLSISHGIIRAHGGEIRAQNRPTGGARFWFELPRAIPPRPR